MTDWIKCTTTDGIEVRVNAAHVAIIRPYRSERGFTGSEVVFATGTPRGLPAAIHFSTSYSRPVRQSRTSSLDSSDGGLSGGLAICVCGSCVKHSTLRPHQRAVDFQNSSREIPALRESQR